jgi:hypothetical protein
MPQSTYFSWKKGSWKKGSLPILSIISDWFTTGAGE